MKDERILLYQIVEWFKGRNDEVDDEESPR